MYKLKVITSTVREGRKGPMIAEWVMNRLKNNTVFETELLELGQVNLPVSTEPFPPAMHKYQHPTTKEWAAKIGEADAFIIVLAEYNHSFPAPIKNAIDTVGAEWRDKPVAFVTYGGISGGTRSMISLVPSLTANSMVPLTYAAVCFPFFEQLINKENGRFEPGEKSEKALDSTITELTNRTKLLRGKL